MIVSVVGRKDAGKTAVVEELIRILKKRGMRVGAIKHSEKGELRLEPDGVDTLRLKEAGADAVTFATDKRSIMMTFSLPLETVLAFFEVVFDVVVIEGLRESNYPKFVVDDGEYKNIVARIDVRNDGWRKRLEESVSCMDFSRGSDAALFADERVVPVNRFVEELSIRLIRAFFGALRGVEDTSIVALLARSK